jgi:hypothetical protein
MKLFRDLLIVFVAVFAVACANDAPGSQNLGPAPTPINPSAITAPAGAATAVGMAHYICPNNCANSGDANAGACPVCGTAYIHNAAFHNQANPAAAPTTAPAAATAVNPNGVYHYTCTNGCAGGAGTAQPCATCGNQLVHNAAFHEPGAAGGAATPAPGSKSPLFIDNN